MKKLAGLWCIILVVGAGCKKENSPGPEEVLTKFAAPNWKVESGRYSASMTAVLSLPVALQQQMGDNDELAAFVKDECRSEGVKVKVGNQTLYFLLIAGQPDEQNPVTVKYFNAKTAYMYQANSVVTFKIDDVFGTAQNPKFLVLEQVK